MTGDVGLITPEGYLKIVDRVKDMILVSGFNVYPNELEEVAAMHAGILEAAAVGVPDATSGEAVKLFVVRKDPALTAELDQLLKPRPSGSPRDQHPIQRTPGSQGFPDGVNSRKQGH